MLNRRQFLGVVGAAASWQAAGLRGSPIGEWGSPVFDLHFHMRGAGRCDNLAHLDGAGITTANLLTRAAGSRSSSRAAGGRARPVYVVLQRRSVATPDGVRRAHARVKSGAQGFGEMKYPPRHRRPGVPAAVRTRGRAARADSDPLSGSRSLRERRHVEPGIRQELRAHAEGLSEDDVHRSCGRVLGECERRLSQRGRISVRPDRARRHHRQTARRLSEPLRRFVGQLGQQHALARRGFTRDFLRRHQNKLLFGSDCGCTDGHGGGVSQANNPAAARLAGKCVARETLTVLKRSTSPDDLPEDRLGQRALAAEDSGVIRMRHVAWRSARPAPRRLTPRAASPDVNRRCVLLMVGSSKAGRRCRH